MLGLGLGVGLEQQQQQQVKEHPEFQNMAPKLFKIRAQ